MRQCPVCQEIVDPDVLCATAACPFAQAPRAPSAGLGTTGRADQTVQAGLDRLDEGAREASRRVLLFVLGLGAMAFAVAIGITGVLLIGGRTAPETQAGSQASEQADGAVSILEEADAGVPTPTASIPDSAEIPEEETADFVQDSAEPSHSSQFADDARLSSGETYPRRARLPEPGGQATAAMPRGNPGNWVTTNDYPSRALREEREGITGFRVQIGPDGRVADCEITSSSGHADLDEATCDNVSRRARFDPAIDSQGTPTTGAYSNRIRWAIP